MSQSANTLLLRQPTVSKEHLAFVYAGDIWMVERNGGIARRLTAHPGTEATPMFSPDGNWIAFSGNHSGNYSVYIIPPDGGSPRKLTFHPGSDWVRGWTPDGQHIVFSSSRDVVSQRYRRLFTLPLEGGLPQPLKIPMAERCAYSPDGTQIAYTVITDAFWTWKRYRGGMTTPIWIFDLQTHDVQEIPHENASDTFPCWIGDTIYFLSDRNHTMNLFAYDTQSKTVRQVTHHTDFDVRHASAGAGVIVYEQAGRLHLFDPSTETSQSLTIRVTPDLPHTQPHYKKAVPFIRNADLSPTGARAVFEARGDIFTVPAKKGDIRNLTRTPDVHERYPTWSPDGKWIAYLSDVSSEYQLILREQAGLEEPTVIPLGDATFYYSPKWAPDSQKIAYTDKRLNLYYIDIEEKNPVRIDTDTYDHPQRTLDPVWSPDSKWIAYTKRLDNHIHAIFFYELATGETHQVTDGRSDTISPCFSLDGKYLFFAASSNLGLNTGWLDMSSYERPVRRSLYVMVLNKELPSPLAPESDEEKVDGEGEEEEEEEKKTDDEKDKKEKKKVEVKIDLDNIDQRILALPMPERNYSHLKGAADGKLFYFETVENQEGNTLHCFDMKERKSESFLEKVYSYWISHNGKKVLYQSPRDTYTIAKTDKKPTSDGTNSDDDDKVRKLNLDRMEVYVDPKAEWNQMFNEVVRIQRDFFYDPNMHGADWVAICEQYRPFLKHVGHREDLNYIFGEMFGELVVGHAYVGGGDTPKIDHISVGLLGADYEVVDGYYRIKRIYRGLNWHPDLRAPLTEPGVDVAEGDFVLAVNGRPLKAPTNIYSLFEKTVDRMAVLKVNSKPTEQNARTVNVVPIASEAALRHWCWVDENRRKVDELSNGRVAYVYMPDTSVGGYSAFNRYYFSQLDREAVILDERFNGGGSAADYIIDMLNRPLLSHWATREGKTFTTPNASIFGPKVMIINEYAGSGGDAMPLYFRRRGIGKLIGKRTWGGLVGIYDYPPLMDGGTVTAPRLAIFSPDGTWEVENEGVPPDIEVEMTPKLVIEGRDPQLEKAVEVVLEELEAHPVKKAPRPPYPNRVK